MSLIVRMRRLRIPDVLVRLLLCAACILAIAGPAAAAEVRFTALEDISTAVFELNNALRVTRVTNEAGKALQTERVTQDYTVRVTLPEGLSKDQSQTLTFEYE